MILLECRGLTKNYVKANETICAVDDVSFTLKLGESLGIVGESGSGKTTITQMIAMFEKPDSGSIEFAGHGNLEGMRRRNRQNVYRDLQMVFQNPFDSFDPRQTIGVAIREAAINLGVKRQQANAATAEILATVGLKQELLTRYRHQISGGECQRAAIAKALIAKPQLLICDEVTSALDASVQAQIIDLLLSLKASATLTYLFISHDLAVVSLLCDHILVLRQGRVVERGTTAEVLHAPQHPYTQLLLDAIPRLGHSQKRRP
jgi:peptide/nickel transport system ATP-binding protein